MAADLFAARMAALRWQRGIGRMRILGVDPFFRGGDNKKVLGVLDWSTSSDLLEV